MIYIACVGAGVMLCIVIQILIAYLDVDEVNGDEDEYL